jgi:hypothetical protein
MFFLILLECGNDGYKNLDVEVNRKIEIFNKSRVNRTLIIPKEPSCEFNSVDRDVTYYMQCKS